MAKTKVVILGGGVGGLSAAHELIERGFDVEVYEAGGMWGGKARSLLWDPKTPKETQTGVARPDIDKPLPSEHGFRFFPAFYKHLPDTMKRIPFPGNKQGVYDNLVGATEVGVFRSGKDGKHVVLPGRFPTSTTEWEDGFYKLLHARFSIPDHEMRFFVEKLLVILTSCQDRRLAEYEKTDWWSFIGADREDFSDAYKKVFGVGLTRSLVAMRAEVASARTVGNILLQLVLYMFIMDVNDDRVLNAPTNEAWINPWTAYLTERGVKLHLHAPTVRLESDGAKITGVVVKQNGVEATLVADYYICAFPVEVMTRLVNQKDEATGKIPEWSEKLLQAAPSLRRVDRLGTEWMNGIQFYLKRELPVLHGHVIFLDSAWALTSISQRQFWKNGVEKYGDGQVKDILSVDISNWIAPGSAKVEGRPAKLCSHKEIAEEVWDQLKAHLNKDGKIVLDDNDRLDWFLDPDITVERDQEGKIVSRNAEPLLVNTVNSWHNRPTATLKEIRNLMLASDYVQTNTDLATMEGANEAARAAVNEILEQASSTQQRCRIWPLEEPEIFAPLRDLDQVRFNQGLPHVPQSWMTMALAGGLHWGSALGGAVPLPVLRAGWNTNESFGLPIFRAAWNIGEKLAGPVLKIGGAVFQTGRNIGGPVVDPLWEASRKYHGPISDPVLKAGWNTAMVMAALLKALAKKPPES